MREELREPSLGRQPAVEGLSFDFSLPTPTVAELLGKRYTSEMQEAFPDVPLPYFPFGYLALVQLRKPRKKIGSLIIPDSETDVERYRTQASLVRSLGHACFRDRQTGEPWVEGPWYKPGDFVRSPLFGGDRFDIEFPAADGKGRDKVTFAFMKEADMVALVVGDPLNIANS